MSKSLGNFFTVRELVDKGFAASTIRYFLSSVHYRAPLNLTEDGLEAAQKAVDRLNESARALESAAAAGKVDDSALLATLTRSADEMEFSIVVDRTAISAADRCAAGHRTTTITTGFDRAVGPRTVHVAATLPWQCAGARLRTP